MALRGTRAPRAFPAPRAHRARRAGRDFPARPASLEKKAKSECPGSLGLQAVTDCPAYAACPAHPALREILARTESRVKLASLGRKD